MTLLNFLLFLALTHNGLLLLYLLREGTKQTSKAIFIYSDGAAQPCSPVTVNSS